MSGNRNLDAQIAQAMIPRFNAMQAVQQMQRPQAPINPFFGGQVRAPIPMNFGLPQAAQIPAGYVPRPAYMPGQFVSPYQQYQPVAATETPVAVDSGHGGAN